MSSQMIIRVDPELKEKIVRYARSEGKNVSQMVRELLKDYIKSRDIGAYVDDLWNRVGKKLKRKGKTREDMESVLKSVRSDKRHIRSGKWPTRLGNDRHDPKNDTDRS